MSRIPEDSIDLRTRISRRRLLSGLGALSVALTAPVWNVSTAFGKDAGAASGAARRFIGIFSANGTIAAEFFPGFSNLVTTSPNKVPGVTSGTEVPLTASSLGRILQPLSAHVSQMTVLQGVDMISTVSNQLGTTVAKPGGPHMKGPGAMLTGGSLLPGSFPGAGGPAGNADRISVDQVIAQRLGTKTAFPSLQYGARVSGGAPLNCISYSAANQPNVPIDDPVQMYTTMFHDAGVSAAQLQQLLADRKSVLDFVQADIAALQTRLTTADKTRLDAHLTGIRSLEQSLSNAATACTAPAAPTGLNKTAPDYFAQSVKLELDLMILALSCGMTNVATFMFANADSWQFYPFANGNPVGSSPGGANEEHHATSHCSDNDKANIENLVLMNIWQAQQVNYLLDRLAALSEPDGSNVLDNSLILWGNELGVGNTHDYRNIPWVVMGGAGGAVKSGRFLRYPGVPHNNLLVSVCHAMGFADVNTFGIPGVCTGPLSGPSLSA